MTFYLMWASKIKTGLFYQTEAIKWLPCALSQYTLTVALTTLTVVPLFNGVMRGERGLERENCKSVVREIPLRLQRAMTCLITFMFDWVQCSLKVAWRKLDFPLPKYYSASLFQTIHQGPIQFTTLPILQIPSGTLCLIPSLIAPMWPKKATKT